MNILHYKKLKVGGYAAHKSGLMLFLVVGVRFAAALHSALTLKSKNYKSFLFAGYSVSLLLLPFADWKNSGCDFHWRKERSA